MTLAIGVIGGHGATLHDQHWATLAGLGRAIAQRDCTLITGTCPGLPYIERQGGHPWMCSPVFDMLRR